MSDKKKKKIEEIVEASLEEAKKKRLAEAAKAKEEAEEESEEESEEEDEDEDDEKKTVKEDTSAADSLKPGAKSIPDPAALSDSKIGMMSGVMNAMGGMEKSHMLDFFNSVMAQYGPGKDYGVGDKSSSNKATLNMKPSNAVSSSVKEDVEDMFAGQELTEEFKEKASVLFEAAVNAKVLLEFAKLEEAYAESIQEEITEFKESITEKLDVYLDYVVETWMEENKVAIESTLRNEIMEKVIGELKNVFVENYIDVPEEKIDVIESLAEKVDSLEQLLDETIVENSEMKSIISDVAKKEIIEGLSSDLAQTQQEKFLALSEGIEFDGDLENYTRKLEIIKETYFKKQVTNSPSNIHEETFEGDTGTEVITNATINRYAQAISKTVKR
jgi:methyltransferase-like protein